MEILPFYLVVSGRLSEEEELLTAMGLVGRRAGADMAGDTCGFPRASRCFTRYPSHLGLERRRRRLFLFRIGSMYHLLLGLELTKGREGRSGVGTEGKENKRDGELGPAATPCVYSFEF